MTLSMSSYRISAASRTIRESRKIDFAGPYYLAEKSYSSLNLHNSILNNAVKQQNASTRFRQLSISKGLAMSPATLGTVTPVSEFDRRLCPLKFGSSVNPLKDKLPDRVKIVIAGGGAQGMAIAYKLAMKGYGSDTVVLDQGEIGGGSTWHSAGIVNLLAQSAIEMKLSR